MSNNKKTQSWAALKEHQKTLSTLHMRDAFDDNPKRFDEFHIALDGMLFDYSKHRITGETQELLMTLARSCALERYRDDMFAGEAINTSENRTVLHTALRGSAQPRLEIDGENIDSFVNQTLKRIESLSDKVRGHDKITDIISIGIGGSDIGPRMVCDALADNASGPHMHFISNVDGGPLSALLDQLKPEHTLFLIASKNFGTVETNTNAETAKAWLMDTLSEKAWPEHFIAITQNSEAAKAFGISDYNTLPMREWIGGRYSLWSAIGLPIAISFGFREFKALLSGAQAMDEHFKTAPLEKNIPVLMGMLGIWYRNFFGFTAQAILPYAQALESLPAYVQQLDMESNGKHVTRDGKMIEHATSPIVFGGQGTNAQHAFFQHLHQGTDIIPADFIAVINHEHGLDNHHTTLLANALAQAQALMQGNGDGETPHQDFPGNRPSSMIMLDQLDAYHLGMLLALYEHKAVVQGCIWDINSFDQWGVELGKKLAQNITDALETKAVLEADSSTQNLIKHISLRKE